MSSPRLKRRRLSGDERSSPGTANQTPTANVGTLKRPTRRPASHSTLTGSPTSARKRGTAVQPSRPEENGQDAAGDAEQSVYDDFSGALEGKRVSGKSKDEPTTAKSRAAQPTPKGRSSLRRQSKAHLVEQQEEAQELSAASPTITARKPRTKNRASLSGTKHAEERTPDGRPRRSIDAEISPGEDSITPSRRSATRSSVRNCPLGESGNASDTITSGRVEEAPSPTANNLASLHPSGRSAAMRSNALAQAPQTGHAKKASLLPEETSPFYQPKSRERKTIAVDVPQQVKARPEIHDSLVLLKRIVLEKLTGKRNVPLIGLDDEYHKVYQLVEHTITAGEGNSMLVIGARGSGKSALVDKVVSELAKEHREHFHIIRLNGFIHTDDKLALREIWRQLGKEMEIEDDSLGKNYADTLSTLLALLSHPAEISGQETDQVAKAVIFVMDEFDLFASHPRQTLLYNLFDIAQSRKAPIAVLGLTTRIDVSDSLEKRVKSRFSHRYVHLSLAKSHSVFKDICKAALQVHFEELSVDERTELSRFVDATPKKPKTGAHRPDILTSWNSAVDALLADGSLVSSHLGPPYHLTKSIPDMLMSFVLPMSLIPPDQFPSLNPANYGIKVGELFGHSILEPPDSKLHLLPQLSELQLALLISAARLDIILDTDTCNFNMAYNEYSTLAAKARIANAASGAVATGGATAKVWGKEVARREWERLIKWELLIPVIGLKTGGAGQGEMVRCDVALEEIIPSCGSGMDRTLERWCRHI